MRRSNGVRGRGTGLRNGLAALAVAATVTVVLGHTYQLTDTGEFVLHDDSNVRRIVVTQGSSFRLGVLDSGGCTADIRAAGGNKSIVSVSNPKSTGYVQDHIFQFMANRPGTTTYKISVRGEAFNGGDEFCDESSSNPIQITVVPAAGSDQAFAKSIRPVFKNLKSALNQARANLKVRLRQIQADFLKNGVDLNQSILLTSVAVAAALFEQVALLQQAQADIQTQERTRVLADPVLVSRPTPLGLLRGGCGAWDKLRDDLLKLLSSERAKTKKELKKHFATIVRDYERRGGTLLPAFTFCEGGKIGMEKGFELDPYERAPRLSARLQFVAAYAFRAPLSDIVKRAIAISGTVDGGATSVRSRISDSMGELSMLDGAPTEGTTFGRIHTEFDREFDQKVQIEVMPNTDESAARSRYVLTPVFKTRAYSDF